LRVQRAEQGQERLAGFWISGGDGADAALAQWWRDLLQGGGPLAMPARQMLAPGAREGGARVPATPASAQLCTCLDVSVAAASAALASADGDPAQRLARVQAQLKCGTNCGSCLPRLRRMAQEAAERAPV
jgi:assimilatory nitrate reductase catalytic subunit